ncbi:hypothetical protein PHLCEN_2v11855 [Hermanssonia centrifuga]|uniref:Uncharacterized protein n=1 Tax=Hermanssonia centrifuga TaxID=98765 RepID=A0A2R6NIU9_9APHY|nr:hypothetical protein PHLCEN_2v11855 [Hermanssonia centrifuga]
MDITFDTTWCPNCARQILPKRIQVPIASPVSPAPPPSSPTSQPKTDAAAPNAARITRSKTGTIRARGGGLVHGTGRVKPNGTIKRPSPKDAQTSTKKPTAPAVPATTPTPSAPVRHRTVIDQSPVPLYCSDECRLADLQSSQGIDINYHPDRYSSPPLPPVPNNSLTSELSPSETSDSSTGSSLESEASSISTHSVGLTSPTSISPKDTIPDYPIPRRYAALASIYDLPPCPPPPPLMRTDTSSSEESERYTNDYQSGVIMAARRITEALAPRPEPKKRPSWSTPSTQFNTALALQATRNQVVPGWTDGSDKWRASVYSFAAPSGGDDSAEEERMMRAYTYKGFVSTPLRSTGVYSTIGDPSTPTPSSSAPAYNPGPQMARARSEAEELYSKFDMSFSRRSESRMSLSHQMLSTSPTGSTRSLPTTVSSSYSRKREVPILKKGAEGKLLVPDVKMKRSDSGLSSCSSSWTGTSVSGTSRRRSPLSRQNSEASVMEEDVTVRSPIEQSASGQSWSYKDQTYPIMQLPPKREKRIERRMVDGVERDVVVEVMVVPERKRLFLFPGKESLPRC